FILGHEGDTEVFHSDLKLIPEAGVGIYTSFNTRGNSPAGPTSVRLALLRPFLDRYFPYQPRVLPTLQSAPADAARVPGWYLISPTPEYALNMFNALLQTKVTANTDGTISVSVLKDYSGALKRWREIGPLIYQHGDGQSRLSFITDGQGQIRHFATDDV